MKVLVAGGSGMLAGLCRSLLQRGDAVFVLARSESRIRAIATGIEPIVCDYNDIDTLRTKLAALPPPDLVIAWVHGRSPEVRRALASAIRPGGRFLQVLGSAHGDPSHPERLAEMAKHAEGLPVTYQAAVLGFVVEDGRSRWLSNEEISAGVFTAVESAAPLSIIGTVEPWSARP